MSALHFIRVFCILFLIFVFTIGHAQAKYKIKLVSLERCKIEPSRAYKNPPLSYNMFARKVDRQTTLILVNLTVTERAGPVFFNARGYQVQQSSSKDLILNLRKIPCDNPITKKLMKTVDIKIDKNCFAMPGNYSSDKINIEDFAPILTKAMIGTGKYSYELEICSDKGVAACMAVVCDISEGK